MHNPLKVAASSFASDGALSYGIRPPQMRDGDGSDHARNPREQPEDRRGARLLPGATTFATERAVLPVDDDEHSAAENGQRGFESFAQSSSGSRNPSAAVAMQWTMQNDEAASPTPSKRGWESFLIISGISCWSARAGAGRGEICSACRRHACAPGTAGRVRRARVRASGRCSRAARS